MAKVKKAFFCKECGAEAPKWLGQCQECGAWGSMTEEIISKEPARASMRLVGESRQRPVKLSDIDKSNIVRIDMSSSQVNRVLGGGLVPGSLVLLGGEPGIGKSTLTLQLAMHSGQRTLYVSGEESAEQIKIRAERLGEGAGETLILSDTSLESILSHAKAEKPDMMVVDSIQTIFSEALDSSPGGVSQIRECASSLLRFAKESQIPIFIIGHITKEGSIAGPMVLEHIVDVVLQFEGDANNVYRILRGIKNRFGATNEIGIFEMCSTGLREVDDVSQVLLSHYEEPLAGVAVGATIEGVRPYLIETQALASTATYGTPQRSATGLDNKRLAMINAVIEKHLNIRISSKDLFLNIAGGFKTNDPGLDIAVVAAILSSILDRPLGEGLCFAGEIGLSGEIRPASRTEQRLQEAARLGFKRIVVSGYARKSIVSEPKGIEVIYVTRVDELMKKIFH